uniref:Pherophorin domain-containing protein n=1 Tax=Tetradesmus obliquus TaxID=3088 RepID=A0A383W729_TETOB|eukprot:jgi/Sobl393_1/7429/SZX73455.1
MAWGLLANLAVIVLLLAAATVRGDVTQRHDNLAGHRTLLQQQQAGPAGAATAASLGSAAAAVRGTQQLPAVPPNPTTNAVAAAVKYAAGTAATSTAPTATASTAGATTAAAAAAAAAPRSTPSRPLQATAAAADAAAECPAKSVFLSAPGCPCTMHMADGPQRSGPLSDTRAGQAIAAMRKAAKYNVCPAGFRCSPSAAAYLVSVGWQPPPAAADKASLRSNSSSSANMTLAEEFSFEPTGLQAALARRGICIPCQLGEYCPPGTQEASLLSLSTCALQPLTANPSGKEGSLGQIVGSARACRGFSACPEVRL